MDIGTIASFLTYFAILLGIGFAAYKSSAQEVIDEGEGSSFIVGGRSLNFWVTALSAHASDMSNWLFMGFPAAIYVGGLVELWVAIGLTFFMFLNWHYIAPKLRIETERSKTYTLASFFEWRFKDDSGTIRMLSAFMSVIFFTIYLSAGLYGIGKLFEFAFGVPYALGIVFGIVIMVAYTTLGGFVAVAWTDLFQGFFLLAMILIVPWVALGKVGGISAVISAAKAQGVSLSLIPSYSLASLSRIIMIVLGWGLGYFGLPHVLTKFMGIANPDDIRKSKIVGITWQIITLGAAACVGLVALAYFSNGILDKELIFVTMTQELFSPYFAGLILCAILAATISTIDSQMLVLAGVLTDDLYKRTYRPKATHKELVRVFRLSIVSIGCVAAFIALAKISTIYELVWYAWSGLGCTFGPVVVTSLYGGKQVNRYGAIAGILAGGTISGLWPLARTTVPGMIPGFFGSLALIYIVSWVTRD